MLKKLTKEDWIIMSIILGVTTILCNAFLQMHFSSDTYVLYDLGYMKYPSEYFLLDGRLISTIVCYLAGILNISIPVYIVGMDIIGVIILSITIFILYKTILKIIPPKNILIKVLILFTTYILILNQFSLEFLLFPESAVMCLGVFLSVISAIKVVSDEKYKYIKIFVLMLFAIYCYQGLINIFPILAMALIFLKQINNEKSFKENVIYFIKEIFKIGIVLVILLVANLVTIKISCNIIGDSSYRTIQLTDWECVQIRARTVAKYMDSIWNQSMNLLPKHINSAVVILTTLLLIINKEKKETIAKYLFVVFVAFIVCAVPMFFFNTGVCGRVNVPIAEIWGISLLFLLVSIEHKEHKSKYIKNIIYGVIIISFVLNSIMILRNTAEHIAANKVDDNMGKTIKSALEKYEEESGNTVTKFAYAYDINPQQYAPGIKKIGSLTERKIACSWSISQAMNYYCERKFEKVRMPIRIYTEKMTRKDYEEFSEEQLVFEGDTLYLLVY